MKPSQWAQLVRYRAISRFILFRVGLSIVITVRVSTVNNLTCARDHAMPVIRNKGRDVYMADASKVENNKVVRFHYTLTNDAGEQLIHHWCQTTGLPAWG